MKFKNFKKALALLMSVIVICTAFSFSAYAEDEKTESTTAGETTTSVSTEQAQKTLEQQRSELEKKLAQSEKKLKSFSGDAKETEEYIDALDEKIGYMNEELTVLDNQIATAQKKADELKKQIDPLQKELDKLEKDFSVYQKKFDKLQDDFQTTYDMYCMRLKAMYVSGNQSFVEALLTSNDISQFLSRYEMVKAVSKSDADLMREVDSKMKEILTQQDGLNEKKQQVNDAKSKLDEKKADYDKQQKTIESNQAEIAKTKVTLSEERAESDALLAKYTEQTQMYTEYRNEDQALIDKVDKEIDDLLGGLKSPEEITTVDTSNKDYKPSSSSSDKSELYSRSDAVLNLTYPAPSHYAVSQNFGHYRNGKAHTGIDFPCPTGSKIVAAQKGIVITVKRLNYSYGYYIMVYHGTDSRGRKIVTLYAHNSSILVSPGQTVKKGQTIARSGSTGNSTGPHCHFEMIVNGSKVNPKNYLAK